jgi:hypothetical protein
VLRPIALVAVAFALAALALAALGCAGGKGAQAGAGAGATTRRSFAVPGEGVLELSVPSGWDVREGEGDASSPRTIELAPAGKPFVALVSPIVNPEKSQTREGADTAQLLAELSRRKAAETAVEAEIPLMEVVGEGGVHGYWFQVTDRTMEGKTPKEGEYRHLIQGAAAVGPLLVAFTLLDNGAGPHRRQILEVVRTARITGAGGTGGGGQPSARAAPEGGGTGGGDERLSGFEPDPGAGTVPLVVEDPGKRVSALVDLPGFKMFRPRASEDGKGLVVLGQNPETGIVASVILRDAPGLDARACRDEALARIRKATPELTDIATRDAGGVARAAYMLSELNGQPMRQQHAHAFAARNGVCVNLHLSKAEPVAEDRERFEKILASLRFGEAL